MTENFWDRVKLLLKTKKITQKALNSHLGYPERTIEQWIARSYYPPVNEAVRISQFLDTTVEYLVTGTSSNTRKDKLSDVKEQLQKIIDSI